MWICSAILFVVLIFGSVVEALWTANVIKGHTLQLEVCFTLLMISYLSAHTAILFMISSRAPGKRSRRSTRTSWSSSGQASTTMGDSRSASRASLFSTEASFYDELEGTEPLELTQEEAQENASWADPFVPLPQVDARPLLSDVSEL
jgi:hypothetical protein